MKKIYKSLILILCLVFLTSCNKSGKERAKEEKLDGCNDYNFQQLIDDYFLDYEWKNDSSITGTVLYNNKPYDITIDILSNDKFDISINNNLIDKKVLINKMCNAKKLKDSGNSYILKVPVKAYYNEELYFVDYPEYVNVKIYGNRDIIESYKNNMYAYLDLNNLTGTNSVYYGIDFENGQIENENNYYFVQEESEIVDIVKGMKKTVPVTIKLSDENLKNQIVEINNDKEIEIYGSNEDVKKVEKVYIYIKKDNSNHFIIDKDNSKAVDNNNKKMNNIKINIKNFNIKITSF